MTISTVEEFWSLLNNIKNPTQLTVGSNYHFFKDKINPEWEDVANKNGGKWAFAIKKGADGRSTKQTDDIWVHTLLMLIGDQFTDGIWAVDVASRLPTRPPTPSNSTAATNTSPRPLSPSPHPHHAVATNR